jgi:hypothetical protein
MRLVLTQGLLLTVLSMMKGLGFWLLFGQQHLLDLLVAHVFLLGCLVIRLVILKVGRSAHVVAKLSHICWVGRVLLTQVLNVLLEDGVSAESLPG